MLFFGLAIAALVVVGLFAFTLLAPHVRDVPHGTTTDESAIETVNATGTRAQFRNVPRQPVPPGFHGPTGVPHINGPTSPPPNY